MGRFLAFLFAFFTIFLKAQSTQILSHSTDQPISKIVIFGENGNILTTTDIDGKFNHSELLSQQSTYRLVYKNQTLEELTYEKLTQPIIKVDDRIKGIEPVIIKKPAPSKYLFIKGNFNSVLTINNRPNCYVDGVITYVFDNKTKKLKSHKVEQYRIFKINIADQNRKQISTMIFDNMLDIPELKSISKLANAQQDKTQNKYKEISGTQYDHVEFSTKALQEKEFSFFGYRFFDALLNANFAFEKNSAKDLKSFVEFNETEHIKLKHKSEPNYNQLSKYVNFYPTELYFDNEDNLEKVKYNVRNSQYSYKYWDEPGFPNLLPVFQQYFADQMEEMPNKK